MNEKIIYQFRKNHTEEVICTLKTWNGKKFFDIRVFYRNGNNELRPSSKGICLSIEQIAEIKHTTSLLETCLCAKNHSL